MEETQSTPRLSTLLSSVDVERIQLRDGLVRLFPPREQADALTAGDYVFVVTRDDDRYDGYVMEVDGRRVKVSVS